MPVLWVAVTIFVAPLMFFMNKGIFEAITLNFKALGIYFLLADWADLADFTDVADDALCLPTRFGKSTKLILSFAL
jgi:hypothetical protein